MGQNLDEMLLIYVVPSPPVGLGLEEQKINLYFSEHPPKSKRTRSQFEFLTQRDSKEANLHLPEQQIHRFGVQAVLGSIGDAIKLSDHVQLAGTQMTLQKGKLLTMPS